MVMGGNDEHYWSLHTNTPVRNTWEGLAFERVCFGHIRQIKQALGITGVSTQVYSLYQFSVQQVITIDDLFT